jgi:hypothetical protein
MAVFRPKTVDELKERVLRLFPDSEFDTDESGQFIVRLNYAEDQDSGDLIELVSADDFEDDELTELGEMEDDDEEDDA